MNLPKTTIMDSRLTHGALGILVRALECGGANSETIVDFFPQGKAVVLKQMKLLKKLGYMRQLIRRTEGGRLECVNEFSDRPNLEWINKAENGRHYE